ncbi:hypothetical protein D1872_268770 [compost metagenome]
MGNKEYKNKAAIAVFIPIPNIGIITPRSAKLGMVCKILALPITHLFKAGTLVTRIPSGTPITIAISIEMNTSSK